MLVLYVQAQSIVWTLVNTSHERSMARFDHAFTKQGDKFISFGGRTAFNSITDEFLIMTSDMKWYNIKKSQTWPSARFDTVLLNSAGVLTLVGGSINKTHTVGDVWQFKNEWKNVKVTAGAELIQRTCHSGLTIEQVPITMLFGGKDHTGNLTNDIIISNPGDVSQWSRVTTTKAGPSPRQWTPIVYIPHMKGFVLFGGYTGNTSVSDFWFFSMKEWTELKAPPVQARSGHSMFYDEQNDVLVIFGGDDKDGKGLNDIWIYHVKEAIWSKVQVEGVAPTARSGAATYLQVSSEGQIGFLLFGGVYWDKSEILGDVWTATIYLNKK